MDQAMRQPPVLQRRGGATCVVVGGVSLEVVHENIGGTSCGRSNGCSEEVNTKDADSDDEGLEMMTWFFEDGFSLASATGFARVWPGASALIRALDDDADPVRQAFETAAEARKAARASPGNRNAPVCVELGAGCGLVGLAAAAVAGADVLLTDTAPVVQGVLERNVARNTVAWSSSSQDGAISSATAPWPGAQRLGLGTVAAAVLDWTRPVSDQLQGPSWYPDVILAAECVWLAELVEPFADAAAALLHRREYCGAVDESQGDAFLTLTMLRPVLFLSSRERAKAGSTTFSRVHSALSALAARRCGDCQLVAQYDSDAGLDDGEDEEGPLLVYAVRSDRPTSNAE
mmetsp:Transcript_38779/g.76855  ORF Transcript_38779/g.76855 Transcript_38779/m.76855 type:complete len:346 (+) Transcript_38779:68-1105(+)